MLTAPATTRPNARLGAAIAVLLAAAIWPGTIRAQTMAHETSPDRTPPESTTASPAASDQTEEQTVEAESSASEASDDDRADDPAPHAETFFGDAHRRRIYREGKRDVRTAALRTALFPGLGNFYANQYFIGGVNASLMGFTAILVPYGLVTDQPGFAWAGLGVAAAAYTSGFITSAIGVKRYNRRLRRRLRITDPEGESARRSRSPWAIPRAPVINVRLPF